MTNNIIEFFDNSVNIKIIYQVNEYNIKNGPYIQYYENGIKTSECIYNNGRLNGYSITYYNNGTKKSVCYFDNDVLCGEYLLFYANGIEKIKCYYKFGEKDNEYVEKFINGLIKKKCFFKDGKLNGEYIVNYYHDTMELNKIHCHYVEGLLNNEYIEYYSNLNIKIKCNYKYGLLDGEYICFNENNILTQHIIYKLNKIVKYIIMNDNFQYINLDDNFKFNKDEKVSNVQCDICNINSYLCYNNYVKINCGHTFHLKCLTNKLFAYEQLKFIDTQQNKQQLCPICFNKIKWEECKNIIIE